MNKFGKWLQGRYGYDELSFVLIGIGFILLVLSYFRIFRLLYIAAVIILVLTFMRSFSSNLEARQREKNLYMIAKSKMISFFTVRARMWRDRKTMKYIKCTSCKAYLRVPKHKGKIEVTCPKCHAKVITKT